MWTCSSAISFVPIHLNWYSDDRFYNVADDVINDLEAELNLTTTSTLAANATSLPPLATVAMETCGLRVNGLYAIISSSTSFYVPLTVMIVAYVRIYRIARQQVRLLLCALIWKVNHFG